MKPTEDKGCPSSFIMSKKGSKEQKFSKCSIQDIRKEIDSVRAKEQNKLRRCVSKLPEKTSDILPCEQSLCLKTVPYDENDDNFSICEQSRNGSPICFSAHRLVVYFEKCFFKCKFKNFFVSLKIIYHL